MTGWTYGLAAIASFVAATPVLITFHTLPLWMITLAATEYGHRLALLPLLISIVSLRSHPLVSLIALIAACVFLIPLAQAVRIAAVLPDKLDDAFSMMSPALPKPLSVSALWLGGKPTPVEPQSLTYVNDANGERKLLYFPSQTTIPAPCLIVIHSGGWENGRPEEFPLWNHHWAREGYAVAAIGYRLAPHSQWPAQREDVAEALRFLKAESAKLGIDSSRFVLIGRSAGGQIATASAYTLNDPSVRGCISLYAPADMPFAWQYADPNDVLDSPRLMRQYLGGGATEAEDKYLSSSGTLIVKEGCPPTLMIHGDRDILVWNKQSERLAAKLEAVNVPHYHLALPWATHALDYPFNGPGAQLTRYAIDRFLQRVLD